MRATPNVLTLAPGPGGLARVIAGLMSGEILGLSFAGAPETLADLTVFLPHKRLKAQFEAALRAELGPRPVILPRIRLLGAPGDALEDIEIADLAALTPERRIMSPMERRFRLLPLVAAWRDRLPDRARPGATEVTLRETLALAGALGQLIDEMRINGVPLTRLAEAAPPGFDPARFDAYWQHSRAFLRIAAEHWPAALAELGAVEAVEARIARLEAEAQRLESAPPSTPLLMLGSTGSVAATGRLMRAISRLDHGAVVLPGLDLDLPDADFALPGDVKDRDLSIATQFAHPQAILKATLHDINIPRIAVRALLPAQENAARRRALSDMMRPAETVAQWRESRPLIPPEAFAGIGVVEAQDEHEEALAIALAMRETLVTPGRRVALVSPDRQLLRRVQIELSRWEIAVRDPAGSTLRESPAGRFLLLLLDAAREASGALMAMLTHPLAHLGFARAALCASAQALDLAVLRGHRFRVADPLAARVAHARGAIGRHSHPAVQRLAPAALEALPVLAKALDDLLSPLRAGAPRQRLAEFARILAATLEAATRDETGTSHIGATPDGGALLNLLAEIAAHPAGEAVAPQALPAALALLMGEKPLPPSGEEHPRAVLLGAFEARLAEADRIILGGLNEGRFPPPATEDPFLNRAMRLELGLPAPEWRIGIMAHDFAQLAATPDLVLTSARRLGESPALPSRFLRRLEAYARKPEWDAMTARGAQILAVARALETPEAPPPAVERPCPVPQAPRVPARLSVTEIETLRRDPYAIYARHLLGLVPLEPPDGSVDPRDRGTLLHTVLERFVREAPPEADAVRRLEQIADEEFEALRHEPELLAFWRQRFAQMAPGFLAYERECRAAGRQVMVEKRGEIALPLPDGGAVTLVGKADRIETHGGQATIIDYKSGSAPRDADVMAGLAPQLPLLGAMAAQGAFGASLTPTALTHAEIGGGAFRPRAVKTPDAAALAQTHLQGLIDTLGALARGEEGYLAQKAPAGDRPGDYDHLTRRALWGGPAESAEDEP